MKRLKLADWIFLLGLFLIFLLPPTDPDLGWQLRCGQQIWQRQGWCNINQFSVLLEGYNWPNHRWLYQVGIYPLYQSFGFWGLSVFGALVMGLAFWLWYFAVGGSSFDYLSISQSRLEKMGLIGVMSLISWGVFSFGIRSQLLGFLYFNLLLLIFSLLDKKPKLAWLIPLVMFVWANSHGSVVLGLVLLGWWGTKNFKRSKKVILILVMAAVVTLVNPFGMRIYQDAWQHFGGMKLESLIAEWVPPNRNVWWLVLASAVGLFGWLLVEEIREGSREGIGLMEAVLVIPFTFLALKARRHVPFYLVVAGWVFLNRRGGRVIREVKGKENKIREIEEARETLALLIAVSFLFYGLFIRLPLTVKANSSWQSWCQQLPADCPKSAIEFLKPQKPGRVFNRYEWGGFLIWQLPEHKIFVDGRMPAWETPSGKSPYTIYLEILQTQPGWQGTLGDYQIDWIFISPGTFMDLRLKPDPESFGWEEAYRDEVAVVYRRRD